MKIELCDGKYSVYNRGGILEIYRYSERWPGKEKSVIGDGFVLALVQEIEDCLQEIDRLSAELNGHGME